ncbi:hypothetical protein PG994_006573 [Apiospora phragmitis]|uniref:DUF7924 domain-containing protein n=1 Tax=Apiospora phragmitis TaxID=2905665 RepID=A0ABR1VFM0_9PEZI
MFLPQYVPGGAANDRVAVPEPDLTYGYYQGRKYDYDSDDDTMSLFRRVQKLTCGELNPSMGTGHDAGYPFFIVDIAADGPREGGGLWAATNQCLGGAAACVEAINKLNRIVRQRGGPDVPQVDVTVFSIAANQYTVELLVSYSAVEEQRCCYYTRRVASFLLCDPDHILKFRRYVLNILDWGNFQRLDQILDAFNFLVEEANQKRREEVMAGRDRIRPRPRK